MIITISGKAGSGKSTVAKAVAKKLNLKHYSIGDLMRQLAREKNVSLMELGKLAEADESIDRQLDEKQIDLKNEDDFVIDGRLTAFFIPNAAIKVFLDCDEEIRAQRILEDKRHDEKNTDLKETIKKIRQREESERKRYKQYYDIDYYDKSLYDAVIDTSQLKAEEVVQQILDLIENK